MKKLTIINTVLLLAIIGWLIYTRPTTTIDKPEPIPAQAEYVRVDRVAVSSGIYMFTLTDMVSEDDIKDVLGVYVVYERDELAWQFIGNMTVYRTAIGTYVVVKP